jgi:predicted GNAT superfamily acetyltransferase
MRLQLLDPGGPNWSAELDRIGYRLRQPDDPSLFPYHFLQVTLPRIGGGALLVFDGETALGAGFLFPRHEDHAGNRTFTLRLHTYPGHAPPDSAHLAQAADAQHGLRVHVYHPGGPQEFAETHQDYGGVDIGRPNRAEAAAVPVLHQQIWGSPREFLYPADLHSVGFAPGTSLVARVDGKPVGFLIGFNKFCDDVLPGEWQESQKRHHRLESQVLGVLPEYRGLRIANLLKRAQAEQAFRDGISIVNWTADPLQYANAALNFGLLRAIAYRFDADLYPFRNDLNRVQASRFQVTWLVATDRVRGTAATDARATVLDLSHHPEIPVANHGWSHLDYHLTQPMIAIHLPSDWTSLQNTNIAEAVEWRRASDALFSHYVGVEDGRYVVTGVAVKGDERFLIAERATAELWSHLAAAG